MSYFLFSTESPRPSSRVCDSYTSDLGLRENPKFKVQVADTENLLRNYSHTESM